MAISNHLRVNNDTQFLHSLAGGTNRTVEQALEGIATQYQEYLIPGTKLVDFGPAMDGFSPTYQHVMPGSSQGNTVWMLRDFASFRASQGRAEEADSLRAMAAGLANATMEKMYQSFGEHMGRFNVIWPSNNSNKLVVKEMRHVVDFFSVTFGLCGLQQPGSSLCDFSSTVRGELGNWFRRESLASSWIRATSPRTNCNNSWEISSKTPLPPPPPPPLSKEPFPAFTTCAAGRPDHGSNGAYPSWPAFAAEALCYLDGNCSSAFEILSSFALNTWEGPFGQAHGAPQLSTPPYTPFNDEPSYKPSAGSMRYIAIEGGSFFDAIVRGLFGYHAPLQWPTSASASSTQHSLDGCLHNRRVPRGFLGTLKNLRTPHGLATIASSAEGLSIQLQ